jgi:uncharacterized membrane protein
MFCNKCGTNVEPNAQFCPGCGQTMGAAPPPQASVPQAFVPPATATVQTGKWISEAWQLVQTDIVMFGVAALLLMVVGGAVPVILQGAMAIGFNIMIVKKLAFGKLDVGDLFKGFNFFVPALVAHILISIFTTIGVLLCIVPGLVIAAMYMFTFLFILDKKMEFWPAMQASMELVKKDYMGFTLFFLALVLLQILGALACIVGLFITIPIMYVAIAIAYRDLVGFDPQTQNL